MKACPHEAAGQLQLTSRDNLEQGMAETSRR